jgi:metal-sulfur cluster biosynthetic enzyme
MSDRDVLREAILARLSSVVDPETGADVVRMRLIEDLAVVLALSIRQAVGEVEGVTGQEIEVIGYVRAEELNAMLRELA